MTNAQTVRDLEAARKLIEKPENWCKGAEARDADGNRVSDYSTKAVSYCALGAISRATKGRGATRRYSAAWSALERATVVGSIAAYNDAPRRTHKQILKLFDRAISRARSA